MQDAGHSPQESSIRMIVAAGEPGPCVPSTRNASRTLWHASLHDDFGCTEVAMSPLGYTCREQLGRADGQVDVHLMEDAYLPEVLHPGNHAYKIRPRRAIPGCWW